MANQQAYHAYAQNKGTLVPGQTISVNKFNVQVERYLSQGGFAHVYLVRTATPVYNTTHHVLKRIAVANDVMLTEVKKEVDIMRLLKGHPNIVHLIDAAWHKMPNGMYEVFILMEFCPGGGIIDMMNRRLRERLTESEILQIFVDVCEGVAYMHNARPPLLHRDLKVENILQSSPTSFKLCDFGSATTVARPPATTQEIKALEADLNRHTTLQYRAPEMVDPYSRRPVDEKSDVWALGVLLYKLCYYTTPFEEHGPLAILNVQYRIPPYPLYSSQMNQLIGSMLQEHGISRPSVFEILAHVHTLRGTKSRFQYTIPVPQPLSPRQSQFKPSSSQSNSFSTVSSSGQPNSSSTKIMGTTTSPTPLLKNQGIQAREKVLEAIAPMRRGRPPISKEPVSSSTPEGSQKQAALLSKGKLWANEDFVLEDDSVWKTVTSTSLPAGKDSAEDAWKIGDEELARIHRNEKGQGFGDDFAEKLWDSFDPTTTTNAPRKADINNDSKPSISKPKTHALTGPTSKERDAFAGLGLGMSTEKQAPTLGEARKLRTGLAVMNANTNGFRHDRDRINANSSRLTPSPRPSQNSSNSQLQPHPLVSNSSGSSWRASSQHPTNPPSQFDGLPIESRFPSLEELDATFSPAEGSSSNHKSTSKPADKGSLHRQNSNFGRGTTNNLLKAGSHSRGIYGQDGVRSEQVTGVAMRESRGGNIIHANGKGGVIEGAKPINVKPMGEHPLDQSIPMPRPTLSRKHRSSVTIKHGSHLSAGEDGFIIASHAPPTVEHLAPPSPLPSTNSSKDWLTGDDDHNSPPTSLVTSLPRAVTPVLRDSPSKRASLIQKSDVPILDPVTALHDHTLLHRRTPSPARIEPTKVSPTISRFTRHLQDLHDNLKDNTTENRNPVNSRKPREAESSSSTDEGPEDAVGVTHPITKSKEDSRRIRRKGRQSSVHDLVDLWGGGVGPKDKERESYSSRLMENDSEPSYQKKKMQSASSSLELAKSKSNPRSTSPHQLLSPPSASFGQQGTSNNHSNKSTSSGSTMSPSPTRSRPQSMFSFPSRSTDGLSLPLTDSGLAPPPLEDPPQEPRTRRISISDMVQRYEGISGKTKSTGLGGPPSPSVSKFVGKSGATLIENGRYSRGRTNLEVEKANKLLPIQNERSSPSKSPTDTNRVFPVPTRTSPVGVSIPLQHDVIGEYENPMPRPRRSSFKPEMARPIFPSRKSTEEAAIRPSEGRSSSPERPYQGVGKLIDQWQRKTAEVEPPRTGVGNLRSNIIAKRGGLNGPSGGGR
ncbi:hypothetical protein BDZ94DRAFT_1151605 [Collybia nuda]|uniref:non-specific serine/threonine protein kinase n=1 Tax=Collybia nuda TaxID=64659 RepID=A0A9P5YJK0_9AGAR|nr:hypothetical protein BDZ94DRAFT_1151605 [Collybia nuda]